MNYPKDMVLSVARRTPGKASPLASAAVICGLAMGAWCGVIAGASAVRSALQAPPAMQRDCPESIALTSERAPAIVRVPSLDSRPVPSASVEAMGAISAPSVSLAGMQEGKDRKGATAMQGPESDADHIVRLMHTRLHCGESYDNDRGGRNSDCVIR